MLVNIVFVTLSSRSLIDLCITNTPTKVAKFGVVHLAISYHALICMTYKVQHERAGTIIIKTRQMKNFHNATTMQLQKQLRHPTLTRENSSTLYRASPWITDHLRHEMHRRNFLKKKAVLGGSPLAWDQYKRVRNHTNNEITNAKRKYFTDNLESSKSNPKKNLAIN